jgi:type VI protein secretion system component Hcp
MARKNRPAVSVEPLEDRLVPALYLNFDSVSGEAPPSNPSDYIQIESWSFGIPVVPPATSSTTPSAGKATIQDIVIVRKTDAATPTLFQKCLSGEQIPQVHLEFFKPDNAAQPFLDYVLKDVLISDYRQSSSGDCPAETFNLNFTKIDQLSPSPPCDATPTTPPAGGTTLTQDPANTVPQSLASNTQPPGQLPSDNTLTLLPINEPFRPRRLHVRRGQAPVFVGQSGEVIRVDKSGWVKVQLIWHRPGDPSAASSWIRPIQVWAGKEWGSLFIPRIGQEVVVAFEEGNPDQPVVIARIKHGGR